MKSTKVPTDVYEDVRALDGDRCAWCYAVHGDGRRKTLEFHHRLPRSRARNLHDRFNGVMLCVEHHHEAHAENVWPWLIPGSTLRGEYRGPDRLYAAVYNATDVVPTIADLAAEHPDHPLQAVEWAITRARIGISWGVRVPR